MITSSVLDPFLRLVYKQEEGKEASLEADFEFFSFPFCHDHNEPVQMEMEAPKLGRLSSL